MLISIVISIFYTTNFLVVYRGLKSGRIFFLGFGAGFDDIPKTARSGFGARFRAGFRAGFGAKIESDNLT